MQSTRTLYGLVFLVLSLCQSLAELSAEGALSVQKRMYISVRRHKNTVDGEKVNAARGVRNQYLVHIADGYTDSQSPKLHIEDTINKNTVHRSSRSIHQRMNHNKHVTENVTSSWENISDITPELGMSGNVSHKDSNGTRIAKTTDIRTTHFEYSSVNDPGWETLSRNNQHNQLNHSSQSHSTDGAKTPGRVKSTIKDYFPNNTFINGDINMTTFHRYVRTGESSDFSQVNEYTEHNTRHNRKKDNVHGHMITESINQEMNNSRRIMSEHANLPVTNNKTTVGNYSEGDYFNSTTNNVLEIPEDLQVSNDSSYCASCRRRAIAEERARGLRVDKFKNLLVRKLGRDPNSFSGDSRRILPDHAKLPVADNTTTTGNFSEGEDYNSTTINVLEELDLQASNDSSDCASCKRRAIAQKRVRGIRVEIFKNLLARKLRRDPNSLPADSRRIVLEPTKLPVADNTTSINFSEGEYFSSTTNNVLEVLEDLQVTNTSSDCPSCTSPANTEERIKGMRLEMFKNLLAQKLRRDPYSLSGDSGGNVEANIPIIPETLVEQTLKDNAREYERDEFHARDQELIIAGEDMGRDCIKLHVTGCYRFRIKGRIRDDVAEARLWLYKMEDSNDVSGQTFNVYGLERMKSGRLGHSSMIASVDTLAKQDWVVLNITRSLLKWVEKRKGMGLVAIRCATCATRNHRALYGAKHGYKPLLIVKYVVNNHLARGKRSASCDPRYDCCKRDLVVNFQEIGMYDILQPRQLSVGYCFGECNESHNYVSNHTAIRQRVRGSEPLAGQHLMKQQLKPCCVPMILKDIFIMTSDGDGSIVRKLLPKVVVETCGCM